MIPPSDAESIRSLRPDDVNGIVALYAACTATEPGIGPVTAEGYAGWLRLARFGHGRDFLVAMKGREVVGLAESSLRDGGPQLCRFVEILVHPSHRRRGLGTALLRAVSDQGPSAEPLLIESLLRPAWAAGLGFVARLGFAVTETEIIMRCPVLRPITEGPAGLTIARTGAGLDAGRVAEIHDAAYRDEAGFVPMTGQETLDSLEDAHLWTVRLAGQVVAFAIIEPHEDLTWLESLAVDPPHQGRGIGGVLATRALLGDGLGVARPAGLNVSASNAPARKLYARLGFEKRSEMPRYGILRDDLLRRRDA